MPANRNDRTYRVQHIPAIFDWQQLPGLLSAAIEDDIQNVEVFSLAPSPYPAEQSRFMVATVMFKQTPAKLDTDSSEWRFFFESFGKSYELVLDTHFLGLTPLNNIPDSDVVYNCLAVPGLASHPFGTWKSKSLSGRQSFMWLRDKLPEDVPGVRIILYGYDTQLVNSNSFQTIHELGQKLAETLKLLPERPVVFLTHSLGGVVLKTAIVVLSRDQGIAFQRIQDIFLFGVPNQGMTMSHLLSMADDRPNRALIQQLSPNSIDLAKLDENFISAIAPYGLHITSVFETKLSRTVEKSDTGRWEKSGPLEVLVDRSSAVHTLSHEGHPFDRDHSDLVKFSSTDHDCHWVISKLKMIWQRLTETNEFMPNSSYLSSTLKRKADNELLVERRALSFRHGTTNPSSDDATNYETHPESVLSSVVETQSFEERQKNLFDSLEFPQIDARLENIKKAYGKTCAWLFKLPKFQSWLNPNDLHSHNGFLWLKGKPGAGKSTLMKYLFEQTKKENVRSVLSFFFNARGEALEKGTLGMYRSILLQLLKLNDSFLNEILAKHPSTTTSNWTIEQLQQIIRDFLVQKASIPITCFIDALDECKEQEVREMVEFLEDISQAAIENGADLRICLSSRHYPHISIDQGLELILEQQTGHEQDIESYVKNKLKAGKSSQIAEIQDKILSRAYGVFLWVVLVVAKLKMPYDHGDVKSMQEILAITPDKLEDLFADILTRDNENMEKSILCLQWVLFSRRSLRPVELYYAILAGTEPSSLEISADEEVTEKFILSCSKGLVEKTRSKSRTVQFIHESVRDFLRGESGLQRFLQEHGSSWIGHSHDQLKKCCQTYFLKVDTSPHYSSDTQLPPAPSAQAKELRELVKSKFPFLEYSVHNIFEHAEAAEESGVSQYSFLESLWAESSKNLKTWIQYDNLLHIYDIRKHSLEAQVLYVFSERGLQSLVALVLEGEVDINHATERYGTALQAAVSAKSGRIVQLLLDNGADVHATPEGVQSALIMAVKTRQVSTTLFLLRNGSAESWRQERYSGAFHLAFSNDDIEILRILINCGIATRYSWKIQKSPLDMAVERGRDAMVRFLISSGIDFLSDINDASSLWTMAVRSGQTKVIHALFDGGANIEAKDVLGQSPLLYAVILNSFNVVQTLLDLGADIESKDDNGRSPLSCAVSNYDQTMVQTLLDRGADIESKSNDGRSPLSCAISNNDINTVQALLDRGADIESKSNDGRSPLSYAARFEYSSIARLLLDRGADMESKSNDGRTPLSYAADHYMPDVARILLDRGADIESKSNDGRTPLSYAVERHNSDSARLLLERGADIDSKSNDGRTPLSYAVEYYNSSLVHELLERGADIESKSNDGRTSLSYAAEHYNSDLARVLLERGADIESKSNTGRTPLSYAAEHYDPEPARELLDRGADVMAIDNDGNTPLSRARKNENPSLVQLFQHYPNFDDYG